MVNLKIGFISDTHGDVAAFEEAFKILRDSDFIIHAGDVLYHGIFNPILKTYNPLKLAEKINQINVPLYIARGNCDSEVDRLALEIPFESNVVHIVSPNGKILVHHGHLYEKEKLFNWAKKDGSKLVVTGHTHLYMLEEKDGVVFLNPGSPSLPKEGREPSIAVYEDGEIYIKGLKSQKKLLSLHINL